MTTGQKLLDKLSELFKIKITRDGRRKMFFHDYEIFVSYVSDTVIFLSVFNDKSKNLTVSCRYTLDPLSISIENVQAHFLNWLAARINDVLSKFEKEKQKFEKRKVRFENLEKRANKTKEILGKMNRE